MRVFREEGLRQDEMRQAYRRACEEFAASLRRVQNLSARPGDNRDSIDAALLELERARVNYSAARDALAQLLGASGSLSGSNHALPVIEQDSQPPSAGRVKLIAELLWEAAGQPDGTAEDDWRRAEEIVRCATAVA
jgi:hypothetical protein